MLYYESKLGKLYNGDFKDIQSELEDESIDLVFTDPPYPREYIYTYQYLAEYCPRLMKNGASLLTIVPHYRIPDTVKLFDGKLKYRWLLHMSQFDGSHPRMAMGIEVTFKPILWYVKKSYPMGRGYLVDGIKINKSEKAYHEWQQSTNWAEYYISKLTKEGDTVFDPYIGSGTVAVVCEKLNRKWIGIDIDTCCMEIIKGRLEDESLNSESNK